jgi:hypothetical protein
MKINFRKISAIAASALMTGMTLGVAAAANYPAPFVSGGVANVAVVYGTGAGVSSLDLVQAGNIQESLGEFVSGGSVVVEGGESFALDKASNHFNLGQALNVPYSSLDDGEMDFLADGTYKDGDVNEDYTQTITPSSKTLTFFTDNDYNDEEPTLGFHWTNGQNILDYDIEFDDAIPFTDLEDTDMPLMGREYYVLDVDFSTNNTITLLDSAEKVVLSEGESLPVEGKTVSIEFISETEVKFNVDGEITDKLSDHEYQELDDGSYIVANEIMYAAKEVGISKVEFSIGAGKLELLNGEEIEVNDEDVDGLVVTFTKSGATGLTNLNFAWASDDDSFLTKENALVMPTFETISLVFGGMDFPEDPEIVSLENGETMKLSMGNYELPLFWLDTDVSTGVGYLGEEDNPIITAVRTLGATLTNASGNLYNATTLAHGGLYLTEDQRFLVTSLDTDLSDIDTLYYEVTKIDYEDDELLVELDDLIGSRDITFDDTDDTPTEGDVTLEIQQVNDTHVFLNFTASSGTISYNTVVSEKGLEVTLPAKYYGQTNDFITGVDLTFIEADKDEDLGTGMQFTATVKNTSNEKLHVALDNVTVEEYADDKYYGYIVSDLATKVTTDETGDEYDWDLEYYGAEVTADVQIVGGAATVSDSENTLGNILVKDTEVSSVATKNLIVVGGSCINSAAAALVGGTKCGAAWTEATGIGAGQFLIKGYADSTITSELALLVAGYEADDTVKATTYLTNKVVDTGTAYKGTTSTETAVVIE